MAKKYWWEDENQQDDTQKSESKSYWWEDSSTSSTVGTNITNRVNTWLENHNNYITNYQTRNSGRKYNYEDSYVSDSASWLETVSKQKSNFDAEADSILSYMDLYKDYLDADWMESVRSTLSDARSTQDIILENSTKDNEWWSNWKTEDEYKTSQRYDGYSKKYTGQKYDDIQKALSTLEDGEEKDWLAYYQYELYKGDSTYMSKATSGYKSYEAQRVAEQEAKAQEEANKTWWDKATEIITDSATATDNPMLDMIMDQRELYAEDTSYREPNDDWSIEQKNRFGYLWAEDHAKAYAYAEQVNNQINAKKKYDQQQAIGANASDNGWSMVGHTIGAVATAPTAIVDLMDDLIEYSARGTITQKGYITPFEYSQAAQSGIANKLNEVDENGVAQNVLSEDWGIFSGKGWGDIYSLGVSTANSMLSAFALGGAGTLVNFIGQGGAAGVDDALSRGATAEQALLYGTAVGALEGLTEMIPAEKLIKTGSSATFKNYIKKALQQSVGEFFEEGASSFFGNLADDLIMKDKSNYNIMVKELMRDNPNMTEEEASSIAFKQMAGDIAFDAIGGAVSGFASGAITGAGATAIDSFKYNQKNIDAVNDYGHKTDALIQEGLQSDKNSESYELAQKYQKQVEGKEGKKGKELTGFQIRNLLAANQEQAVKNTQTFVKDQLKELGENTSEIYTLAEIVTKKVSGQELTRSEKSTLARSQYGAQVAKEMTDAKELAAALIKAAKESSTANKSLTERVGEESNLSVSEDGQAKIRDTDEAFDIKSAEVGTIADGQMTFKSDNGEVSAEDIDWADEDQALLVSAISRIENITPGDATVLIHAYDASSGQSVAEYVNGIDEAYTYGYNKYSEADMGAGKFTQKLSNEQMMSAYKLGQTSRSVSKTAKADAIKKMRTAVDAEVEKLIAEGKTVSKGKMTITYNAGSGNVVDFDKANVKMTTKQKAAPALAKVMHEMGLGTNFELFSSYLSKTMKDEDGNPVRVFLNDMGEEEVAYSGVYRMKDGTIRIDLNAYNGRGLTLDAMSHELTHFIQQWSGEKYEILADFLVKTYEKTDMSMHDRVLREQARLERIRKEDVSYNEAYGEVVANAMSKMLADGKVMDRLAELRAKDMNLAEKLWEGLKKLLTKFFRIYEKESALFHDAADLMELKAEFEQMQKMWADAFVEASENFQMNLMATEIGVEPVAVEDVSQYSYSSLAEAAGFVAVQNEDGTRSFTRDGKKVSEVTVEDIENSPIGAFINFSVEMNDITADDAKRQKQMFADICTMACKTNDFAMTMQFVGSAVFTGMKANADKQYGTTYDFPSICTKTQAVIDAMSAKMKSLGRGLTSDEIVQLYADVFATGNPVPCPECYVFSRWIGIGGLLDNIKKYQDYYGDMDVKDVADAYLKMKAEVSKFAEEQGISFGKAKGAMTSKFTKEFNNLTEKIEKQENQGEKVKPSDRKRLAELEPMMNTVKAMTWLENVYFADSSLKKVNPNFRVPNEVLFDLNNGEAFATQYKEAWAFRTTQGAGYGKAITPYAEARLGEGVLVTNNTTNAIKGRAQGTLNNYFLNQKGKLDKQSRDALKRARMKQKIQAFIGGQRFQSTSDARYENASDYLLAALEMQAMGGMVQAYTKVDGAIPAFSAWGFSSNQSLMPLNGGLDADGNVQDTPVGGMKPSVAFENRNKHESAGTITIGVNDNHIRAMFQQWVRDFIIPYHASGGKADVVAEFRRIQEGKEDEGEAVRSTDYSRTQSDKILSDEVLRWQGKTDAQIQRIHEVRAARIAILTGGKVNMTVVRSNRFLSALYDKLNGGEWDGVKLAKSKVESQIFPNEFWDQTVSYDESAKITKDYLEYCNDLGFLHRFSGLVPSNGMLVPVRGYDQNGNRVQLTDLAYKYDENGNKTDEVEEFFWKVLTDRRMYDNNRKYLPQKVVTLNDTTTETVTGFAKHNQGRQYDKAKAEALAKKIVNGERYSSQETDRIAAVTSDFVSHMINIVNTKHGWYAKDVFKYVEEHPELGFIELIYAKDKQAKKYLEAILNRIDDVKVLDKLSWYMGEAYGDKDRTWNPYDGATYPYRGAVRTFRNAIKKRINAIMTEKVGGTNLGIKNGEVTLADIKGLYSKLNSNEEMKQFAEKVFATSEKLGVNIRFVNQTLSKQRVAGDNLGDMVEYKTSYFNDTAVTDQRKANTILHELIHACTVYVMESNKTMGDVYYGSSKSENYERIANAATRLNRIYNEIQYDPDFKNQYGIKNAKEMVAELANEEFVGLMKKKNLWDRIVDWICDLFGVRRGSSAYDNARLCLDYILDNPEVSEYKAFAAQQRSNARYNGMDVFGQTRFSSQETDLDGFHKRASNKELAEMDDTALYIKNTDKANYIGMIFNGAKTEETRSRRTLDAFIGKDFYVTDGKYVYGSIVLGEPHKYTEAEFHQKKNQLKHRVPVGDKYDIKPGGTKWAYPIESYKKFDKPKKLSDSTEYKNSFQARQVMYSSQETDLDSMGNKLTKEQVEFFRDSKMRDELGRLIAMYHGTNDPNFTVFDPQFSDDQRSLFFTSDPDVANTYTQQQDEGRDVDPYNLITKDSSAEQFNSAQEKAGGGLRVMKITQEWIAEMKRIAMQKYAELIPEAEKYADLLEQSGVEKAINFANRIRTATSKGAEKLTASDISDIQGAMFGGSQAMVFNKNAAVGKAAREQYNVVREMLLPAERYAIAAETSESAVGKYTFTERNSMVPFSVATIGRGNSGSTFAGSESEAVEKALDRTKWVAEHSLGNRYKVYLNLKNPYILDAGTDLSGKMDRVTMSYSYLSNSWRIEMEYGDEELVKYMSRSDFEAFSEAAFDAKTAAKIKEQIEADNDAYLRQWGDLDPDEVEHDIRLENVNISYVEPGNWNDLHDSVVADYFEMDEDEPLKTRNVAKYAMDKGYDGVIFKNMKDTGGYAFMKGRNASTVAVAFNSNQIKSVDNKKPTADKDIRYSSQETDADAVINSLYNYDTVNFDKVVVDWNLEYFEEQWAKGYYGSVVDTIAKQTGKSKKEVWNAFAGVLMKNEGIAKVDGKTYINVHELNEANLRKAFELGGLAAPSIGIVDVDKPLTHFGDISLIFPDIFSPETTPTYYGDSYSASFPAVGRFTDSVMLEDALTYGFDGMDWGGILTQDEVYELLNELDQIYFYDDSQRTSHSISKDGFANAKEFANSYYTKSIDGLRKLYAGMKGKYDSYEQFLEDFAEKAFTNKRMHRTYTGSSDFDFDARRYQFKDYTLENVVDEMTADGDKDFRMALGEKVASSDELLSDGMRARLKAGSHSFYEAKPQRAVYIDEATYAVVPESTSADVIKMLESEGVQVVKYQRKEGYDGIAEGRAEAIKGILEKDTTGVRYSGHETDNISNRDLLANAFEMVVQNSKEYEKLQEYKDHIKGLNKLEAKLSDLNEDIRKMLFDKDTQRDAKKLKKLQDEAKEVAKEINRYDKILLNLEASEPLRKVIERERKKEAKKTKDHVKELLQNKKARAEQTELRHKIRKTIRDLDKILNRGNKKLNVKEDMKGFVSKALELADYIFTDHISNDELIRRGITVRMTPKEAALVKETEDILSKLYDEADSLTDEEFTRLDAKRKANEEKLRDLLKSQRNERLNTPVYNLFNDLVTEYASLKNSKQDSVKAAYDEVLENSLRAFMGDEDRVKILKNMRVADMTTEELNWLYRAYTMVLTNVRNANKFHAKGITETIEQRVGRIAGDFGSRKIPEKKLAIAAQKLANKIGWDYEKLYYALDRIGSEAFSELIMNIADSENTVMQDVMEAIAFRDEMVKNYGFNNWDVNKEIDREFMDNSGKKFKMTLGQLMSLYAYSRREGAWDHIEYGGFVFGEAALTNPRPADSYKLSKEQCEAITSLLTKEQKGYVEDMQKFLSETMGEKGNEVSMLLYGIKMFGEKNYFPIHVAGQFKAQAQESQAKAAAGFSSMSNAGFTHAQNPNAKAPFVLEGFNEIWTDHVNEMSRYHGTVPALEDLRRVMNRSTYSDSVAESQSIKQLMENSFGKEAVDYFDNLYREANSGAITDKLQKNSKKLLSLFRKNSVAYSLSVLIQQPASLVRAYSMIDKKYFGFKGFGAVTSGVAKAVSSKWNPAYANAYNEMLKYAPGVTMAKEIGGFDTATGGSIRSYLLDTGKTLKQKWNTGTALEKGKAVLDVVDDNAIANLPNVADKIAWIEIWNACKREAVARNKNLKPGSDEFMQTVGERFTEVIRATQVYDSIFAKSPMLKSKNLAVQYLVSFMNEPNTVANMAESAVRSATRGDWKQGVRTAAVVIHSIIFTNVLKSIVYALRDDDEDETYIEKYIESVVGGLMDDFNALNYIPIARDVVSLAQGYDVERADMAIVADAVDALSNVFKNAAKNTEDMTEEELAEFDKKVTEANWKLVESVAAFFGIPVKNVRREIMGVIDHARIASANAGQATAQSVWDTISEAVIGSIPFMQSNNTKQDKLYEAIMAGDKDYIARLKSTYKDDSAYQSAVRKALRENDSRIHEAAQAKYEGRTEDYKRIFREIQKEGKFSFDDIMSAINSEESAIKNGLAPDKVTSAYTASEFVESIILGDSKSAEAMKEDIISTKVANGKTQVEAEKEFTSAVVTGIRDAYSSGLLDEAGAENMLKEYAGKDEEEVASKVSYWAFCEENPKYDYFSESNVKDYREFAEPENISLEVYAQFINGTKGLADIKDKWGDVEVTKREQVLEVINSLPLTWQQKDALYLAAGYSESKIWDVPW